MGKRYALLVLAIAIGGLPAVASGTPLFEAQVVISPGCSAVDGALRCVTSSSTTSAVSAGAGPLIEVGIIDTAMDALAIAGPGQLEAVANVAARTPQSAYNLSPIVAYDSARASFFLDDILVSGPAGETAPISFIIATSGGLTNEFDPTMGATASVNVRYGINSSFGGAGFEFGTATRSSGVLTASGAFAGGDLSVTGSTVPWMVRGGETISFSLALVVDASAGCYTFGCPGDRDAFASAGFDTVGFPTVGPVANLPAGWSISSASGLIVDNQFVGSDPVSAVPEPSTIALLGLGLAALGGFSHLRRERL